MAGRHSSHHNIIGVVGNSVRHVITSCSVREKRNKSKFTRHTFFFLRGWNRSAAARTCTKPSARQMTGNSSTIFFLSFFPPFSAASYIIHQLTEYSAQTDTLRHFFSLSSPFFSFWWYCCCCCSGGIPPLPHVTLPTCISSTYRGKSVGTDQDEGGPKKNFLKNSDRHISRIY